VRIHQQAFAFLLLFSLFILACKGNNNQTPKGIVAKDTMAFVLMDIHLAEAGARTITNTPINETVVSYYQFIEKKYHISDATFKQSMQYYTTHPEIMAEIYAKITEEMSKKEAEIQHRP
jgi:hypothetical protein